MLSAIPVTPMGNRVVEVDPACPSMPFYKATTRKRVAAKSGGSAAIDLFGARGNAVVFSTKSYGYMQDQFHALAEFDRGEVLRDDDGIVKGLSVSVEGRDVVIVGGTIDHAETLDLYVMAATPLTKPVRSASPWSSRTSGTRPWSAASRVLVKR